jgi:hypothetical protein
MLKFETSYTCRNRKYTIHVLQLLKRKNRKSALAEVFKDGIPCGQASYTLKGHCLGYQGHGITINDIRDLDVLNGSISFENATKILESL